MKTLAQSLTVSAAIYSALFLLVAGIALGAELKTNTPHDAAMTEVVVSFEEEEYIDDIPFNTELIAVAYYYNESMNVLFEFEEEAYVDDIPFKTEEIASSNNYQYASVK